MSLSPTDNALLERLTNLAAQADQQFQNGKLEESLHSYEECLASAKNLSIRDQVPILLKSEFAPHLYKLGRTLCDRKNLTVGIRALRYVVEIEHNLGDLKAKASLLSDIATIYFDQRCYENAITIYRNEVLPLRVRMNDKSGEARVHKNIGLAYARLGKVSKAYTEIKAGIEKAMNCGASQEAKLGFETAIALVKQGLAIPTDIRKQLWELVCLAEYWDLELEFREEKGDNQDEAAKEFRFKLLHVFISYSHHDKAPAASIAKWLLGIPIFNIFLDQDRLYPGWKWEPILMGALDDADAFVLLVGNDTMSRPYVRKELETYIGLHQVSTRRIIPVLLPGYVGDLPDELSSYQWYDLREGKGTLKECVRLLGGVIWNAVFYPQSELADIGGPRKSPSPNSASESTKETYESGEVFLSPTALVQTMNMGILKGNTMCWHRELDMATLQAKQCEKFADILCIGCGTGACSDLWHAYGRFCTLIPPGDLFEKGTKLFYWCPHCHAPICTRCLGIEDSYPCPSDQVPMYRFQCPSCQKIAQVVPVLDVDFNGVGEALLRWSKVGGPPEGN